jgi:hypothetical protein
MSAGKGKIEDEGGRTGTGMKVRLEMEERKKLVGNRIRIRISRESTES